MRLKSYKEQNYAYIILAFKHTFRAIQTKFDITNMERIIN